jgi:CHAD domain-containing protein
LRALDSARYERLVARATALLQRGPLRRAPAAAVPVLAAAPPLIARRYRKASKLGKRLGPAAPAEAFHALRIECKQLRYALEFLRELYGKPARDLIAPLVRLQDILGWHQDATVAVAFLRDLSLRHARRMPPRTLFAMGRLAERHAQRAAALRNQFPAAFKKIKGRPWERMERALAARQPALPAPRAPRPKSPSPTE